MTKADLYNLDNLENLENLAFPSPLFFCVPGWWVGSVATADLDNIENLVPELENLVPNLENKIFKIGLGDRPRSGDRSQS